MYLRSVYFFISYFQHRNCLLITLRWCSGRSLNLFAVYNAVHRARSLMLIEVFQSTAHASISLGLTVPVVFVLSSALLLISSVVLI